MARVTGTGTCAVGALLLLVTGCDQDYKLQAEASAIEVSPAILDFGHVAVSSEQSLPITLTSVAGGDVVVVAADLLDTSGSYFSVEPGALPTVPAEGTATLTLHYRPEEAGWHTARLTVLTDEEEDNSHFVDLRGHASASSVEVWPIYLDFGPVAVGATVHREVFATNSGDIDTTLESATTFAPVFSVAPALPASLAVGDTLTLDVRYTAAVGDPLSDDLSLRFGTGEEATVHLVVNDCENGEPALYDVDADGWSACAEDCADTDPAVHPGAAETCDGVDQDCDGTRDEGTECFDDDGDTLTELDGDCNDGDALVSPLARERLDNGVDDDCDGVIDLGTNDLDGDGYLDDAGDCDGTNADVYLGAPELVDGLDNDCDGLVDDGTEVYDDDLDGVTEVAGDCDDGDRAIHPAATESGNWTDDDCDGLIDEDTAYGDDDRDGYSEVGGDCDDADATVSPGAQDVVGNGADDNCDGTVE